MGTRLYFRPASDEVNDRVYGVPAGTTERHRAFEYLSGWCPGLAIRLDQFRSEEAQDFLKGFAACDPRDVAPVLVFLDWLDDRGRETGVWRAQVAHNQGRGGSGSWKYGSLDGFPSDHHQLVAYTDEPDVGYAEHCAERALFPGLGDRCLGQVQEEWMTLVHERCPEAAGDWEPWTTSPDGVDGWFAHVGGFSDRQLMGEVLIWCYTYASRSAWEDGVIRRLGDEALAGGVTELYWV